MCTKFHGRDISLKTTIVNLMVALEDKLGDRLRIRIHHLGTTNACTKLCAKPSSKSYLIG